MKKLTNKTSIKMNHTIENLTRTEGMPKHASLLRVAVLRQAAMAWLAGLVMAIVWLLQPLPAMALASPFTSGSDAGALVAAMPNKVKAAAKDTEGKLESAYGELSGNTGRQIKGKAKQVQASAMNVGEDLKEGAKSVAKKVGDASR